MRGSIWLWPPQPLSRSRLIWQPPYGRKRCQWDDAPFIVGKLAIDGGGTITIPKPTIPVPFPAWARYVGLVE